jgi:hypothetical protein
VTKPDLEYGDEDLYEDVKDEFTDTGRDTSKGAIIEYAEGLAETIEENYINPESARVSNPSIFPARRFPMESPPKKNEKLHNRQLGRALRILVDMDDEITKFDEYGETQDKKYDMRKVHSYERLHAVLESISEIPEDELY